MEEKKRDYTTISVSNNLAQKIDKVIQKGGYQNRADFVRDAIRRLLEEVDKRA